MPETRHRLRARPGQPDRRAHRLQRRAGDAVRDRARRHRQSHAGEALEVDALDLGQRDEFTTPERVKGWRAFHRGMIAELRHRAPAAPRDHRRPPARQRPLLLGGARGRARARTAQGEPPATSRRWRRSARGSRTSGSGPRPACWTSSPRCSRSAGHVLRIDFRSLDVEPHPLELGDWQLVTLDSGATHSIAASGYNERRAECRGGVRGARHRLTARGRARLQLHVCARSGATTVIRRWSQSTVGDGENRGVRFHRRRLRDLHSRGNNADDDRHPS